MSLSTTSKHLQGGLFLKHKHLVTTETSKDPLPDFQLLFQVCTSLLQVLYPICQLHAEVSDTVEGFRYLWIRLFKQVNWTLCEDLLCTMDFLAKIFQWVMDRNRVLVRYFSHVILRRVWNREAEYLKILVFTDGRDSLTLIVTSTNSSHLQCQTCPSELLTSGSINSHWREIGTFKKRLVLPTVYCLDDVKL